jgi:hypothetical protein
LSRSRPSDEELFRSIGKQTSTKHYSDHFITICGVGLSELVPKKWDGLQAVFALRGALAHGRTISRNSLTVDGVNWDNSFNGGYDIAWNYLKKIGLVDANQEEHHREAFCFRDAIVDYFVTFARTYITELGEALALRHQPKFKEATSSSDDLWTFHPLTPRS